MVAQSLLESDTAAPLHALTVYDTLRPMAEQGQLTLLGINPHKGTDNFFLHGELVLSIASVEIPIFDPGRIALAPLGELSLRPGNLLGEGDHIHAPLALWDARRRPESRRFGRDLF